MKDYIFKLIPLLLLFLFIFLGNCFDKEEKEKKKKEDEAYYQGIMLECFFFPVPELCSDSYWIRERGASNHGGVIELYDSKGKTCAGLYKTNGFFIYLEDGSKIKESFVTGVKPLKCMNTFYSSTIINNFFNSQFYWYRLKSGTTNQADLIFTHVKITDANGNPSVDSFSDYKVGDTIFCCIAYKRHKANSTRTAQCSGQYDEFSCEKITIQ